MEELKRFRFKDFTQIYFLNGETVNVYNDGAYNYEDVFNDDAYEWGSALIKDGVAHFLKAPSHNAILQAFKLLGYTVKGVDIPQM